MSSTEDKYSKFIKPSWAPPAELFSPIWTVLYMFIAISYGYLFYLGSLNIVGWEVMLPLILNLIFNLLYYPLQFWFNQTFLATIDIVLVLGTLIWALVAIWSTVPQQYHWTAYINIPYLIWVCIATVLQIYVLVKNRK